eukprot:CAMPEP_0177732868 /NCGR_PEP_ID=MMETSP0484_2-20121128/23358_1 /TAXON_ID=354590 /ORGANISM="Rhodomonas lens, Strain RHODO" /LENGTH=372 /DNA_ID=CAMNT_0019246165 /DNA_START=37 /DNA_END=1155 /DNA_ORIENTATION=-
MIRGAALMALCVVSTGSSLAPTRAPPASAQCWETYSSSPQWLHLRGGASPRSIAMATPMAAPSNGHTRPGAPQAKTGTAFTRILFKKEKKETLKTVEVTGSWSKFKSRHQMTRTKDDDFEIIMELPIGDHQIKFVVDGTNWKCHPDLDISTDAQGIQNNVIHVSSIPAVKTAAKIKETAPEGVYLPARDSIDIAKDMVSRLEQEKRMAQEKLAKAHAQLVDTLKGELTQGLTALEKGKKHVASFSALGTKGLVQVKESGDAKVAEIRAHMAKIRAILDQKEQIAIAAVNENLNMRLATLESEVQGYKAISPDLQKLVDDANEALKKAPSDPSSFVTLAQDLVPKIENATSQAAALRPPTDDASFDHLQLNVE